MRILSFILIALLLTGCSKVFVIKPSGSISSEVRFEFYDSEEARTPSNFKIVELIVQKQVDGGTWVTTWELSGKRRMSSAVYAEDYEGLDEIVAAAQWEASTNYRVLAAEVSATGPKGYAGSEFRFSESGEIVVQEYR